MSRTPRIRVILVLVGLVIVGASILIYDFYKTNSYPLDPLGVTYRGSGSKSISLPDLSGPSVIHIAAGTGKVPFQLVVISAQQENELIYATGPLDEYRGYEFRSASLNRLEIKSDQTWAVTISPANPRYFSVLKIPGKFAGNGNAVFFLDGEYGVATFQINPKQDFTAWAFGPGGVGEQLYITSSGDYKGKSVLPIGAGWIIVSAQGTWAVDIQPPCCKAPPGYK